MNDQRKPFPAPCMCWEYPVVHQHAPGSMLPVGVAPQLREGEIMQVGIVALKDFSDEDIKEELDRRKRDAAEEAKRKLAIMLPDVLEQARLVPDFPSFADEVEEVLEALRDWGYGSDQD